MPKCIYPLDNLQNLSIIYKMEKNLPLKLTTKIYHKNLVHKINIIRHYKFSRPEKHGFYCDLKDKQHIKIDTRVLCQTTGRYRSQDLMCLETKESCYEIINRKGIKLTEKRRKSLDINAIIPSASIPCTSSQARRQII